MGERSAVRKRQLLVYFQTRFVRKVSEVMHATIRISMIGQWRLYSCAALIDQQLSFKQHVQHEGIKLFTSSVYGSYVVV